MENKTFSHQEITQLKALLRHVCSLAIAAVSVSNGHAGEEVEEADLHNHIRLLQSTMDRMGWIADVTLKRLGDHGCFDSAEDWMLPGLAGPA